MFRSSAQETVHACSPVLGVLEEKPVGGVRVDLELGVWDAGSQEMAVGHRCEPVLGAITDQYGGVDALEQVTSVVSPAPQ